MKNTTTKKNLHSQPSEKSRWAYWMQAIEPTSEAINKAFPDYHPQWVQSSQQLNISAENFKSLRLSMGLTIAECAAYLRVTTKTIYTWENNRAPVPFAAFELLRLVMESVRFKMSHVNWDGWFISDDGMLNSPDIGGNGFSPEILNYSTMVRNEAALLRVEVTKLQSKLNASVIENNNLRQMYLDNGVTDEVAAIQQKINGLMIRINTARVFPFTIIEDEQPQEKAA